MKNETKLAEHSLSEWRLWRARFPELQLTHFRDKLDWLIGGRPEDPKVSLENLMFFHTKMSEGNAVEAARQLFKFFDQHHSIFGNSGWVLAALGKLVLQNESAAQEFIKPYWRRARRPLAKSTEAAYEALSVVEGEHRKHWLRATAWMIQFYQKNHRSKEADTRFVNRALNAYRDRPGAVQHSCLTDERLRAIAKTVLGHHHLRLTELCDQALVELHPDTSRSTLSHVRATVHKRYAQARR